MPAGSLQTLIVCQPSGSPASPCPAGEAPATVQAYVIDPASSTFFDQLFDSGHLELLLNGGFDGSAVEIGFLGILSMFIVGFTVGVVVNLVRKGKP